MNYEYYHWALFSYLIWFLIKQYNTLIETHHIERADFFQSLTFHCEWTLESTFLIYYDYDWYATRYADDLTLVLPSSVPLFSWQNKDWNVGILHVSGLNKKKNLPWHAASYYSWIWLVNHTRYFPLGFHLLEPSPIGWDQLLFQDFTGLFFSSSFEIFFFFPFFFFPGWGAQPVY